jgi:hypothetical protein
MRFEDVLHRRARSGACFPYDEILVGKLCHLDAPFRREWVIGRGDDHERVLCKRRFEDLVRRIASDSRCAVSLHEVRHYVLRRMSRQHAITVLCVAGE